MRWVAGLGVFVAALLLGAGAGHARTAAATVAVYPAGASFTATGAPPSGAVSSVALSMPIGGVDDATILVRGASHVTIDSPTIDSPLQLNLLFAHYVAVNGTPVPDALEPWDGSQRSAEKTNQPVWLQVTVPSSASPGVYHGSVQVVADTVTTVVPIVVTVFNVHLPALGQLSGALMTAFNFSPQAYGAEVDKLYGITADQSLPALFDFFSRYRLSPNNWGYGNPDSKSGYTSSAKWWLDKSGQMISAVGSPRRFGSMWIPISNNRWPKSSYVGGLSPFAPQTWCAYLRSVHGFWDSHGWLNGSYPYLYALDEPGATLFKTVAQQATVAHSCFPGSHVTITGVPSAANKFLWNGGSDDVDNWVVLASRYYGKYTVPEQTKKHISHATQYLKLINGARKRGKQIWTYTYAAGSHSTPGFTATEPLTDPRLFVDWASLEQITGLLYGEGTTTYGSTNPLVSIDRAAGSFVLIYPSRSGPMPSARLEEIREGIEDWEILNIVRQQHGQGAVTNLLSSLFSTTSAGAKLACTIGCPLTSSTPYSWPTYSRDATTPAKLAAMRLAALTAAS